MLDVGGQDATEAFEDVGHSDEAREILEGLLIGDLKRQVRASLFLETRTPQLIRPPLCSLATQHPRSQHHPPARLLQATAPAWVSACTLLSSSVLALRTPGTNILKVRRACLCRGRSQDVSQ